MAARIQVGIIGLGKFGLAFGKALVDLGQEVMGIDSDMDNVRRAQDILTQVYQADGAEKKALEQLGFSDSACLIQAHAPAADHQPLPVPALSPSCQPIGESREHRIP